LERLPAKGERGALMWRQPCNRAKSPKIIRRDYWRFVGNLILAKKTARRFTGRRCLMAFALFRPKQAYHKPQGEEQNEG
jgi:hypothetical protein